MVDIMYYHGNDSTKDLAIAMGKKEEASTPVHPDVVPTSPTAHDQSSSVSSTSSIASPPGDHSNDTSLNNT